MDWLPILCLTEISSCQPPSRTGLPLRNNTGGKAIEFLNRRFKRTRPPPLVGGRIRRNDQRGHPAGSQAGIQLRMRTQRRNRRNDAGTQIFRARPQGDAVAESNLLGVIDPHSLKRHALGAESWTGAITNTVSGPLSRVAGRQPDAGERARRSSCHSSSGRQATCVPGCQAVGRKKPRSREHPEDSKADPGRSAPLVTWTSPRGRCALGRSAPSVFGSESGSGVTPLQDRAGRRRRAQHPLPVVRFGGRIGLAAQCVQRSENGIHLHAQQGRQIRPSRRCGAPWPARNPASGYAHGILARLEVIREKRAVLVGEDLRDGAAAGVFRDQPDAGAHLRRAGGIQDDAGERAIARAWPPPKRPRPAPQPLPSPEF